MVAKTIKYDIIAESIGWKNRSFKDFPFSFEQKIRCRKAVRSI